MSILKTKQLKFWHCPYAPSLSISLVTSAYIMFTSRPIIELSVITCYPMLSPSSSSSSSFVAGVLFDILYLVYHSSTFHVRMLGRECHHNLSPARVLWVALVASTPWSNGGCHRFRRLGGWGIPGDPSIFWMISLVPPSLGNLQLSQKMWISYDFIFTKRTWSIQSIRWLGSDFSSSSSWKCRGEAVKPAVKVGGLFLLKGPGFETSCCFVLACF